MSPAHGHAIALGRGGTARQLLLLVALAVPWAIYYLGIYVPMFIPMAAIGWGIYALRSRRFGWALLGFVAWIAPLGVPFAAGVISWWTGDGYVMQPDAVYYGRASIDPASRLPAAQLGGFRDGSGWATYEPRNAGVRLMTAIAGPARGAYRGPVPSEQVARVVASGGHPVDWRQVARDRVVIGETAVRLDRFVGGALITGCYGFDTRRDDPDESHTPLASGSLWRDRVLLLELRNPIIAEHTARGSGLIVVIDRERGRPFGYIESRDTLRCRFLPPIWAAVNPNYLSAR